MLLDVIYIIIYQLCIQIIFIIYNLSYKINITYQNSKDLFDRKIIIHRKII